jgi:cyclohexanecarboxyl-CoA dehydrogenase
MHFGLTSTQQMYRDQVREYTEENVIGENLDWDGGDNFPQEVYRDYADMGILGMTVPEDVGGTDLDALTTGVIFEQLGRGDVALTMLMMVQNIANGLLYKHGDEHHQKIARQNVEGKVILSWGLTEPDHGGDARSIETRVAPTDDGWLVNGEKTAITAATMGDYIILYGRRPDDEIRTFLIPYDADGVTVTKYDGLGGSVSGWSQVYLEDVEISEDAQIADKSGFKMAMQQFDPSRGWIPLYCLGAAQQTLDETIEYLTEREAFGQAIANLQGPQFEIAEMQTKVETGRLKAYEALWRATEGKDFTKDASMAKWFGTETATQVIHDCMILHGHYGYSDDFGLTKRMKDVIGLEIGEGPHQIQKLVIGREIFGREYLPY